MDDIVTLTPDKRALFKEILKVADNAYRKGANGEPPLPLLKDRIPKGLREDSIVLRFASLVDSMAAEKWEQGRADSALTTEKT